MPGSIIAQTVVDYFDQVDRGDVTIPSKKALLQLSQKIDAVTKKVVDDLLKTLQGSPEHEARVKILEKEPRTAGKFAPSKIILEGSSAIEQSAALDSWLQARAIRKPHTWFFSAGDDCVPVQVKPLKGITPSMMHIFLGATSGARKAPKYADWAENDPTADENQSRFMAPLTALEIVRQPEFSAATVIKESAFKAGQVDSDWRYGSEYACVEDKGQSKDSPKKQRSAGFNAAGLVKEFADAADPIADEVDICPVIQYEDYADEGYEDDLDLTVSPGQIIKAAKKSIVNRQDENLTRLMQRLTIGAIEVPQTPALRERIAKILVK